MTRIVTLIVATLIALGSSHTLADEPARHWNLQEPSQLEWRPADNLPPGAQVAVLEGDPSKEGFFTMRLKMPDGYRVPPHWHPKQERVTVLSGTLNLGSGDTFDPKKAKALGPGTYSSMEPKMPHFAWMTGETVLQLSTLGPWSVTWIDPDDDPRKNRD